MAQRSFVPPLVALNRLIIFSIVARVTEELWIYCPRYKAKIPQAKLDDLRRRALNCATMPQGPCPKGAALIFWHLIGLGHFYQMAHPVSIRSRSSKPVQANQSLSSPK